MVGAGAGLEGNGAGGTVAVVVGGFDVEGVEVGAGCEVDDGDAAVVGGDLLVGCRRRMWTVRLVLAGVPSG